MKPADKEDKQLPEERDRLPRQPRKTEATEPEYQRLVRDINERDREYDLILRIDRIIDTPSIDLYEVYQKVADTLVAGWLAPESVCAMIDIDGRQFKTKNYRETEWKLSGDIWVEAKKVGLIEVNCLEGSIATPEALLSTRKREMLSAVAERLARITERNKAECELRKSEEHFRALAESSSASIWMMNTDYVFTYCNPKVKDQLGFEPKEVIGKSFFDLMPSEYRESFKPLLKEIVRSEKPFERLVNPAVHKDGRVLWYESSGVPFFSDDGKLLGFRCLDLDITKRKQAEEALRRSEEFSSNLLSHTPNPMLVINADTSIEYVNPAFQELTGFTYAELVGRKSPYPWWIAEGVSMNDNGLRVAMQRGSHSIERVFRNKDGQDFWVEITSLPVKSHGELVYFLESWVNTTERKRLRDNMQFYIKQITRAQEEERRRVAHELHDDTVQALFNLMTDIDGIINKSAMPEESIKKLQEHLENIRRTMKAVRRLSHELRPGVLDRFGLIPSIEMLVQEVQKEDLLHCKLRVTGKTRRLLPEAEVAMFRVAQEALRNVRRHSMAKRCEIKLSFVNKETFLSIADDGKGFNLPNVLSSFARKGKLGILGMSERARLLDGEFMIETRLGKGTTVTMRVPISLSSRHSARYE